MSEYMNADGIKAIVDAVLREVRPGNIWDEIKDKSLSDLCSINQDALIDDLYENDPRDRDHRSGIIDHIKIYDRLLGTSRYDAIMCIYQTTEDDPAIRVCVTHDDGFGLYSDQWCAKDKHPS